jgi:MFS family permease
MPAAAGELGTAALLSWTASAYLIASIAGGAAAASLKKGLGARTVLYLSSAVFMVGTVIFALAEIAPVVIVGRTLQGFGEGVVMACCYTLIPEIFPKRLVPHVFAAESVVWVVAALGGPVVAGAITEVWSWRAAIAVSLPASLIFVALIPLCVPKKTANGAAKVTIPIGQLALIVLAIFLLSLSGEIVARPAAVAALVAGALLLVFTVVADKRRATRLFPEHAFRLADPMGAGLLFVAVMTFVEALPSVYVAFMGQKIWALNALEAGFLAATVAISWSLTAIAVAHLPRLAVGAYVWPAPLMMAAGLGAEVAALQWANLPAAIAGQVLIGASFGLSWARLCEHVMETAPDHERDFAAAALPTIQSAGIAVGAAFFGALAGWSNLRPDQPPAEIAAILIPLFTIGALVAAASTIVAMRATQPALARVTPSSVP